MTLNLQKIFIFIFAVIIVALTNILTYKLTREHYYSYGFNSGIVDAKVRIFLKLMDGKHQISECSPEEMKNARLIFSVKAHEIFMISRTFENKALCIAP